MAKSLLAICEYFSSFLHRNDADICRLLVMVDGRCANDVDKLSADEKSGIKHEKKN